MLYRCDVLPDSSPPLCVHCQQHSYQCTWVLPITETRFKRKKKEENASENGSSSASKPRVPKASANTQSQQPSNGTSTSARPQSNVSTPVMGYMQHFSNTSSPNSPAMLAGQQRQLPGMSSAPLQQFPYIPQQQQQLPSSPALSQSLPNHLSGMPATLPPPQTSTSLPTAQPSFQTPPIPSARPTPGGPNAYSPPDQQQRSSTTPSAEARMVGATSLSHLLHSTSTLPVEHLQQYDSKYCQSFEVKSTGDGFIQVANNPKAPFDSSSGYNNGLEPPVGLPAELVEQLVNRYFETTAVRFPVVTRTDFLAATTLSPLLLYTICGVAALAHDIPSHVLRTVKILIAHALKDDEAMNRSSLQTIQGLLLYSYAFELERGAAASRTWFCLGLAVRMAQDIGLHRETAGSSNYDLEQRRRIWGGCIIVDRWMSAW